MVSVNFKLTDMGTIVVSLEKDETLATLLQLCSGKADLDLDGIIAVRNGTVLKGSDLVENGDEIDVFPAISGG